MGNSCSSRKKNGKQEKEEKVTANEGDGKNARKSSVESIPYGEKSPPVLSNEPSSFSQHNGEMRVPEVPPSINVPTKEDSNFLGVVSTAASPLPSSQTPSPYQTPSSTKIHPSLSPTGLPDLSHFSEEVRALLIGAKIADLKMPRVAKELNVYVCADHSGTEFERSALMEHVFPKIRRIFADKGYELIFVDMHWGVPHDCFDDHTYKELCIEQLKSLKEKERLIVLIMLNESFEDPLIPQKISDSDFDIIIKGMTHDTDRELFSKWYCKDENAVPPQYLLQPINTFYPSILTDSDEKRRESIDHWRIESKRMENVLKEAFNGSNESMMLKYMKSLIEDEIDIIINDPPSLAKRSLLVQRNFTQTPAKTSSPLTNSFDESQKSRFVRLKALLDENLPDSQKLTFTVNWHSDGIKPEEIKEHMHYVENLCQKVLENLRRIIENVVEEEAQIESQIANPGIDSNLYLELIQQAIACDSFASDIITHKSLLNQLHSYLCSSSRHPFIIHGPSGCGKTVLMAKLAQEACNWMPNYSIIYRFAAISSESTSELKILRSICEQCCSLYGEHVSLASQILVNRIETINQLLSKVCSERPLIVIIDGLDHVSPCEFDWIPDELPSNMKLILSFGSDTTELESLKKLYSDSSDHLSFPDLVTNESLQIIDNILSQKCRKLMDAQRESLLIAIRDKHSPLYAHLIGHETAQWSSALTVDDLKLNKTTEELVMNTFDRLEKSIGTKVMTSIFGLLAVSKAGLSDSEVIDVLSCDDDVLDRVFSHNTKLLPVRRFPFIVWMRIKMYLHLLLVNRQIGNRYVTIWRNDIYKNLSCKFLSDHNEEMTKYSKSLIDYYKGNWAGGRKKPFSAYGRQESMDRYVLEQPETFGAWTNIRKVEKLPFLTLTGTSEGLKAKDEYLLNPEWIYYKFCGSDPIQFLEEVKLYLSKYDIDKEELLLLSRVVRASSYPLRYDGSQIFTQIYCRLWNFFNTNPNNAQRYVKLRNIYTKSCKPFAASLLPLNTQMMKQITIDSTPSPVTSVHSESNNAKASSYTQLFPIKDDNCHIIAISTESNELMVWNIYHEKSVRTLKGVNQPRDVKMIDRYRALVLCNRELKLYNLNIGTLETKLKGVMNQKMAYYGLYDENFVVALSRNRMYVNLMNLATGDLVTTFKVGEDRFLNSLLVSANGKICVCGDETQKPFPLLVWDLMNRKLIYDLRIPHHEFVTRISAISDDGHYVVSVCKELNTSAPNFIIVYDLQSGTLFKKWKPECNSHSIAISAQNGCVINGIESSHVLVWDLSTGAKKYTLRGHTSPPDVLQTTEKGNLFLSYDSTGHDRSIRIWSLDNGTSYAVFTPDYELSCCRIMPDGKSVIIGFVSSMTLHTLLLCKGVSVEESKTVEMVQYGDSEREGKEFDLTKE